MKTIHPENNWYIVDNTGGVNLYTEDNKVDAWHIATFCDKVYTRNAPHKAVQLVDAEVARDLLNALRMVLDDPSSLDGRPRTYEVVRAAIKKAEGGEV